MVLDIPGALRDLARAVVPLSCAGCGAFDVTLCEPCGALLRGPVRRVEHDAPRLDPVDGSRLWPVWATSAYTGPVRGVVVGWKDRGRTDLDDVLAAAVRRAADAASVDLLRSVPPGAAVQVVPVPSTRSSRRTRGREPVRTLARAVAEHLADRWASRGVEVRALDALEHVPRASRGTRDQVGLGARARGRNLSGSVRARRHARHDSGAVTVLVDDVLTTGATLAECARALRHAGGTLVAGIVVAATPAPDTSAGSPSRLCADQ